MLQKVEFTLQGPPAFPYQTRCWRQDSAPSLLLHMPAGWVVMWEALILGILESSLTQISCSCSIIRKGRPDGFAQGNPRHLFVPLKAHLTVLFPVPWSAYLPLSSFLHTANYVSTLIYAEQRGQGPFKGYPLSFSH